MAGSNTPAKVYITRVFNFGTWEDWREMKRKFSSREIEEAVKHPLRGSWTLRGQALAKVLYDYRIPAAGVISYDV